MTTLSQRSFAAGEVSPALYGRVDTVKYATGLKKLRNGVVMRHGGVSSRPGTTFVGEVKDSSKKARLFPFIFSIEQTYVLEFGHEVIRFIKDGGYITSGGSIYEVVSPYQETELFELKIVQSADVVTIAHPSHATRNLSRLGAASWTLTLHEFAPIMTAPTGVSVTRGTSGSDTYYYKVTAISDATKEESLPSSVGSVGSAGIPNTASPHTVNWAAVSGAQEYLVYKAVNDVYGFLGIAGSTSFKDVGVDPDISDTPPSERNPFSGSGNYPSSVTYVQQRLGFGNTNNKPETVELSRTGMFTNFTRSTPTQDDDSVSFTMSGLKVNRIEHLIDLGGLIVLTSSGEWVVKGNSSGMITPAAINMEQTSYNGASPVPPIVAGGAILYIQAGGSVVRDMVFDHQIDGYSGNELTIFSSHLVDGYTIVDWAYQKIPQNIVWMVRDDGTLLSMTYVREQQIVGWAHHDFHGGFVESVTSVREGNEDALYVLVKRTINNQTVRYVERMASRRLSTETDDVIDFIGMDCALSFDGRNTTSNHTMTLTGGSTWGHEETLTLTSSASFFSSDDVGNEIHFTDSTSAVLRLSITEFTSNTTVSVRPHKTVPSSMQGEAISTWSKAVDQVGDLSHLEGEDVSIFADRFVVSNPNNDTHLVRSVDSNGTVTLDRCYAVVHVGLPITVDIETLDIDVYQSETLADKKKNIDAVTVMVEATRGIFAGGKEPDSDSDLSGLIEVKSRLSENYDSPPSLKTEAVKISIAPGWSKGGRVFIRQTDPLPLSLLSIAVSGLIPIRS